VLLRWRWCQLRHHRRHRVSRRDRCGWLRHDRRGRHRCGRHRRWGDVREPNSPPSSPPDWIKYGVRARRAHPRNRRHPPATNPTPHRARRRTRHRRTRHRSHRQVQQRLGQCGPEQIRLVHHTRIQRSRIETPRRVQTRARTREPAGKPTVQRRGVQARRAREIEREPRASGGATEHSGGGDDPGGHPNPTERTPRLAVLRLLDGAVAFRRAGRRPGLPPLWLTAIPR